MGKRKFWMNDQEAIMGIVMVLLIIGTINVFSSSFVLGENMYNSPYFFLLRHGINLAVGMGAFLFAYKLNYHYWRKGIILLVVSTFVLLVLVLFIGPVINGAKRWILLPFAQIQPAEIAKIVAIFLEAAYISSCIGRGVYSSILSRQFFLILVMAALIEKEPDGTTAAIVVGIPVLLLLIANVQKAGKIFLLAAGPVVTALVCYIQPYRMARIQVLLNPWSHAENEGYQIVQSLSAIGSGGFWGVGLGMGVSKYQYLPEAHTDFAFAVFCQENGFLGALAVFLLFAAFAYYGARIANAATDAFGQILAIGMTFLIVVQGVMNLLMVGGWFPVVGVPLPFISYGGTSLMVSLLSVGILVNIGKHSHPAKRLVISEPPEEVRTALHLVK